jgi:DNA-directed RNA polymerase sigma subunit (sigma70/sigma32)
MPCYDPSPIGRYEDTTKVDKLTRLLCEACQLLEKTGDIEYASDELLEWAVDHNQLDKERLEKSLEEVIAEAKGKFLSTLSDRERKILKK